MPDLNSRLPASMTAGLSFSACFDLPNYPAPDWTITLYLRGPSQIDIASEPSGSQHLLSASPAVTATWLPGEYWYTIRASNGTDVSEVEKGQLLIEQDLVLQPAGYDGRSEAQKALDAIDAVLANRATLDQERYRINNRELYRTPIDQLLKLRSFYRSRVRQERGQSSMGRSVPVRFDQ